MYSSVKYILLSALIITCFSCTKDFDDINSPKTGAITTEPDGLFTVAVQRGSMTWYMYDRLQRYTANQYMQYNTLTGSGSLDHYEPSYGIFSDIWDRSYGDQSWELAPLFYISHTIDVCIERQNPIKEGIARIWKSYLFQRMTDLYGDIPYSEAFVKPLPKFDTQESIYIDLIEQINIGKNLLLSDGNYESYGSADLIYNGSIEKWEKFANVLLLRIALRINNVAPALSQEVIDIVKNGPFFSSNDDNNKMQWDETSSNIYFRNPILVTEVFNNTRVSERMINFLKDHSDPRLFHYAKPAELDGEYRGLKNGMDPNNQTVYDLNYYDRFSRLGEVFVKDDGVTYNIHFAESSFLRAEAAYRGLTDENAEELYNLGIRAAMEMYEVSDDSNQIEDYINQAKIKYNSTNGLEQIITQKWVALCMNGVEAWFEKRRTGYPIFEQLEYSGPINNGQFPRRLTYSASERRLNPQNLQEAIDRIGEDEQTTRVWWDNN